ncbi:cobaltochelatase CobT-related protein [Robbsia andropogonis]|uniref:cobaltochelatase CobT-related protein n=1 Tax=Robbsia andropogonis TaxID=28092 RepID=UPI003D236F38
MPDSPLTSEHAIADHLSKVARTLIGVNDATVVFTAGSASRDGRYITLPARLIDERASLATMIGYVDQLAARACFSDMPAIDALRTPMLRSLAQVLDDHRTAARLTARHPGARCFIAAARAEQARQMRQRWPDLPWRQRLIWHIEQTLWQTTPTIDDPDAESRRVLDGIADILVAARTASSTFDSIRFAFALAARVRALNTDGVNAMMFVPDGDSGGDAADGSDDDVGDTLPDADRTRPPQACDAAAGALADSAESARAPSAGDVADRASAPPGAMPLNHSIPITTAFDTVTDVTGQGAPLAWRRLRNAARAQTAPLRAALERVLQSEEATHWRSEQERGELNRAALFRFAAFPGYRTPFQTRRLMPTRDTAITLLVDRSGSMAASKIALARLCVAALSDAVTRLGFACEVLGYCSVEYPEMRDFYHRWRDAGNQPEGYNRFVEKLDLQIYKRFDSHNLSGIACIECGHENPDGEALSWAATRLMDRRERRHVMMVFSDGYPSTADGDPALLGSDLKRRVEEWRMQGVALVGVGILNDAVESFYPLTAVVDTLQDLPDSAFTLLGKALLKRRHR